MKKKKITKEDIIKKFIELEKKYKKDFPTSNKSISSRYFEFNGYSNRQYLKFFSSFTDLKKEISGEQNLDILIYKKKLYILEKKNKELKKENIKLIKNTVVEDTVLELYKGALTKKRILKEKIKIATSCKDSKIKEAVLVLSDFHLGETVIAEEVHNINEYNSKIMMKRINRVFDYFILYCKKYEIKKINLLLLGDLLSGCHHDELKKTNEFDDVTCIFVLQEYLINKIVEIEKEFSEIKIEILVGNHSRIPEGKPEFKKSAILNYEYILANQMKMYFDLIQKNNKENKIKINVCKSLFNVVTIANRKFLITHGHILSNGSNSFAGIPYYGLAMSASKLDGAFKQFEQLHFSDIIMGHLHSTSKVKTPIGNLYINGSIIGIAEFALYKMKVAGVAEQTMLIVEDGQVNAEIILRGESNIK